jgi:hypothetical protein
VTAIHRALGATVLVLSAFGLASHAASAELTLPRTGWVSWQAPAVDHAPDWCCWSSWKARGASREACRLDSDRRGYGSRDEMTTEAVRVYARVADGKIDRLRVFSATCPVQADTPIHDLGVAAADDSAHWLLDLVKESRADGATRKRVGEDVLAALALNRGDVARDGLAAIARMGAHDETREQAVFWLAQLRGEEGAEIAASVMFNDASADVRAHAAFAVSQSESPRAGASLIRLGETDRDGEVRARAWFWLAQSGAANAEPAIIAALKKDADEEVREQAIFALSQLPDERATRALIAAAEDQSLSREQRKRAVFWLAQSESDAAQMYLEKVLAASAAD